MRHAVSWKAALHSLGLAGALAMAATAAAQAPVPAASQAPVPAAPPPSADITVNGRNAPPAPPLVGGKDFISPMGEPFHSQDSLSGAEHWFAGADANGDGRLTKAEFRADADRFFAILDTDHNGDIGPDEITHYETVIAPEIQVTSTYGDFSKATTDSDGKMVDPPYPSRLGAGRFGYLASPEPIVAADINMDRAVTKAEFEQAADRRFKLLDTNGDGAITRAELPRLGSSRGDAAQ